MENEPVVNKEEKSLFRRLLPGCLAAFGLMVLCGVILFGAIMFFTRDAAAQADAFLTAIKNDDFETAYALFSSEVQDEVGSAENFRQSFTRSNVGIKEWTVLSRNRENNTGEIGGNITYGDGYEGTFVIRLLDNGDGWRIYNAEFPRE